MHYLTCDHCGHPNEVKSEYMVFCTKCQGKIGNNYSEWKRGNPDRTFEDFKQQVCTREADLRTEARADQPKAKGAKFWAGFTVAFIVAFAVFFVVGQKGGEQLASVFRKPAFDQVLANTASKINSSCPVMIDEMTRLDNAAALPGKVFQYNYTLVGMVKDSLDIDELKGYLEPSIVNFVKTDPEMQIMRENEVVLNYSYKDSQGVYLFTVSVTPELYE